MVDEITEEQEIETPAAEIEESQEVEESDSTTEETEEIIEEEVIPEEEEQPKTDYQKRINTLTYKRREAERKLAEAERKLQEQQKQPVETAKKPDRYDFESDDDYLDARFTYEDQVRNTKRKAEKAQETQRKANQEFQGAVQKVIDKGTQEFGDYDEVVVSNPDLIISTGLIEDISSMGDNAYLVAYHLGKNVDKATEIDSLSPYQRALALNGIEKQLTAKAAKKTTSAPPPIKPVGSTTEIVDDKEPEDIEEWAAWRRKQKYGS